MNKSLGDAKILKLSTQLNLHLDVTTNLIFQQLLKQTLQVVNIENKSQSDCSLQPSKAICRNSRKPTQKRCEQYVPIMQNSTSRNVAEGRELKTNEFSFVLKDSTGKEIQTVKMMRRGNVKFSALKFKKVKREGAHKYTVEEV